MLTTNVYTDMATAITPVGLPHNAIVFKGVGGRLPDEYIVYQKLSDAYVAHADGQPIQRRVIMLVTYLCRDSKIDNRETVASKIIAALLSAGWGLFDNGQDLPREAGADFYGLQMQVVKDFFGVSA